jgi:hypothetical protein
MWLKNNSKNNWMQYDLGVCKIDILAESTFEVSDGIGEILLRNLGADNWLVKTEAPKKEVKEKEVEVKPKKKLFKK